VYRVAVLASGSGTNLQALIDAAASGRLHCRIVKVISDRSGSYALERARRAGIPAEVVSRKLYGPALSDRILAALPGDVDMIVLAGFLSILRGSILRRFAGRILNIHPALLPRFGGSGMYGIHVHEAVIAAGERESGCSVHLVDEGTDTGPVVLQTRVPVREGDTPRALAERVLTVEHETLVRAVALRAAELGLTADSDGHGRGR
jgi:phosphoribosylglycinamide formyltransferase-1